MAYIDHIYSFTYKKSNINKLYEYEAGIRGNCARYVFWFFVFNFEYTKKNLKNHKHFCIKYYYDFNQILSQNNTSTMVGIFLYNILRTEIQ